MAISGDTVFSLNCVHVLVLYALYWLAKMISFMRDIKDEVQEGTMCDNFGITTSVVKMKRRNVGLNSRLAEMSVVEQELLTIPGHLGF